MLIKTWNIIHATLPKIEYKYKININTNIHLMNSVYTYDQHPNSDSISVFLNTKYNIIIFISYHKLTSCHDKKVRTQV